MKVSRSFPAGALLYVSRSPAPAQTAPSRPARRAWPKPNPWRSPEKIIREPSARTETCSIRPTPGSQPLILQRLARTLRKAGRLEEAVGAYRDLRRLAAVWIGGLPSDLIAQAELCSLASERGDTAGLSQEAMAFYRDLAAGKWLLDKPRYLYYSDLGRTWCRESRAAPARIRQPPCDRGAEVGSIPRRRGLPGQPRTVFPGEDIAYLAFRNTDPFAMVLVSADVLGSRWWPRTLFDPGGGPKGRPVRP